MANDKLTPVKGADGLFKNPRGRYVIKTSAVSEKTGKLTYGKKTLPEGATKADALRALGEIKEALRTGESAKVPAATSPTLRAYAEPWATRQLARGRWSANGGTAEAVGYRLDRYVMPRLGDFKVDRITFGDLERWLDWMGTQVGARTTRATYSTLRRMIIDGRKDYGHPPLPAYPDPPKAAKDGKDTPLTWDTYDNERGMALTQEQLGKFLDAAKRLSPHGWYPLCVLGFGSDARFSELAVARVEDFDLSNEVGVWLCGRHLVRRQELPGIKWNPRGVVRLLDSQTTKKLRPYLVGKEPGELLFPSDQPKYEFRSQNGLQWFLDLVAKEAELPRMTSKVFRRTYLTLSHLDTMASALSQAQAGHSDAKTTMTYVKPSLEHRREYAKRMGGVLYAVPEATEDPDQGPQ